MSRIFLIGRIVIFLFPIFLVQCNFSFVSEQGQIGFMFFKADGINRECNFEAGSTLLGYGGDNIWGGYSCFIRVDTLVPKRCWIDTGFAVYEYRRSYFSSGNLSDSISIEYDSINQCYYGHFSFSAISPPDTDDIYMGGIKPDTTFDTVIITDGVFICPSSNTMVEK
jgi:hypothetical protein